MRGWRAVPLAVILLVTVPWVLAGCRGRPTATTAETGPSAKAEHEGHEHEKAAETSTAEEKEGAEHEAGPKPESMLEDLASGNDGRIMTALQQMEHLRPGASRDQFRDPVRQLVLNPNCSAEVRAAALGAWVPWVAADPEPALKAALSPNPSLRIAAAGVLREARGPQVDAALEKLKHDPDSTVKRAAADALAEHLGTSHDDASIDVLIADLGHPDGDRSAQAGMKLEQRGRSDRRVVDRLIVALRANPNPAARQSCATILGLTCAGTSDGQAKFAASMKATFRSEASHEPAYDVPVPALIDALGKDPDPTVREAAAFALGTLGSPVAAKALGRALKDPDQYVRRRAAAALIVVPPDEVEDQLIQAAREDKSPAVRRFAVEAMSNLQGDRAGYAVARCLMDPDADVRLYACTVLKKIGTRKQTDALIALFDDPDEDVRWKAVDAVAAFADPGAKSALVAKLNDESPRVALAAERGVHRLGIGARVLTKDERWDYKGFK